MKTYHFLLVLVFLSFQIHAQKIGLLTDDPKAPVHILSSGQVHTPGGLLLLGHRNEGHLELDFDRIQSFVGLLPTPYQWRLQPGGGSVGINLPFPTPVDHTLHVNGTIGIGDFLNHN